jgi:hypothetical protein
MTQKGFLEPQALIKTGRGKSRTACTSTDPQATPRSSSLYHPPAQTYPLAMADDNLLAQVVKAVQEAQSAFQSLCRDHKGIQAPDVEPHDLLALDASLQALGNIVEILEGLDKADVQLELFHSILATPVVVSTSNNQTSMANAMIADMRNLKRRLVDVRHDTTTSRSAVSAAPGRLLSSGEVKSVRRMVEKYNSIVSEVSSGQNLCVFHRQPRYLCSHYEAIWPNPSKNP